MASGVPGAIFDPTPSQPLGGLSTGIGIGNRGVAVATGFNETTFGLLRRIGLPNAEVFPTEYPTKDLQYWKATAPTIVGDPVGASTYLNQSGRTLRVGEIVWAVQP
jgi:hypothetical protein